MKTLFLTGYQKETLEGFVNKLNKSNITSVIDVREIPLSHKNSFSKAFLKKELAKYGVRYYHFSKLGSPNRLRNRLRETKDYLSFFKAYREYISKKKSLISKVIKLVISNGENSTLLCFERHSDLCHRSIIASEILKATKNVKIIPL